MVNFYKVDHHRNKIRRCLGKKNINLARKIRNRSLRYNVLPRTAPFLCSKCGFSTVLLKRIEEHVCMKRNGSTNDFERDIKVVQMGMRSRFKDAMAVLERIPNPQSIRLPKFRILENEPSKEMYGMISVSILPHHSLSKIVKPPVSCSSNDDEVQKRLDDNSALPQKCSEDASSNKQTVNIDLPCAESEMVSQYNNCTDDKYLKHDSCATNFIRPISAEQF
ncbi:unnamed protein product [Onchocerca flexuosa]|uniref:Uncharacterized protein n=1 Tax=Onchocerca flexuosa TaxID=387005 RepID=A0A183HH73_9BILA|nr:unnamed protein product [Onchocerca flexuosa]